MENKLVYRDNGELAVAQGPDAMKLMRVNTLLAGIRLYIRTHGRIQITRGWGIKRLLDEASKITGKKYKIRRGIGKAGDVGTPEAAVHDLEKWMQLAKMSLPKEDTRGNPLV